MVNFASSNRNSSTMVQTGNLLGQVRDADAAHRTLRPQHRDLGRRPAKRRRHDNPGKLPVSSWSSRIAACAGVSPLLIPPPGSCHSPLLTPRTTTTPVLPFKNGSCTQTTVKAFFIGLDALALARRPLALARTRRCARGKGFDNSSVQTLLAFATNPDKTDKTPRPRCICSRSAVPVSWAARWHTDA